MRGLLILGAVALVGMVGVFVSDLAGGDPDTSATDAQQKTATVCLRAESLDVKSDTPSYSGGPRYALDVDGVEGEHHHIAFVYLFDDKAAAKAFFDREKSHAADDPPPKGLKIEQRGSAVVRIVSHDMKAAAVSECVDEAL